MYSLIVAITWSLSGPVLEVDGHEVYVRTHSGSIEVAGFASLAACTSYRLQLPPFLVNGTQVPYTVTGSSCRRST